MDASLSIDLSSVHASAKKKRHKSKSSSDPSSSPSSRVANAILRGNVSELVDLGKVLVGQDDDCALLCFEKALEIDPHHTMGCSTLAIFCETVLRDFDRAETLYRAAASSGLSVHVSNLIVFLRECRLDPTEADRVAAASKIGSLDSVVPPPLPPPPIHVDPQAVSHLYSSGRRKSTSSRPTHRAMPKAPSRPTSSSTSRRRGPDTARRRRHRDELSAQEQRLSEERANVLKEIMALEKEWTGKTKTEEMMKTIVDLELRAVQLADEQALVKETKNGLLSPRADRETALAALIVKRDALHDAIFKIERQCAGRPKDAETLKTLTGLELKFRDVKIEMEELEAKPLLSRKTLR